MEYFEVDAKPAVNSGAATGRSMAKGHHIYELRKGKKGGGFKRRLRKKHYGKRWMLLGSYKPHREKPKKKRRWHEPRAGQWGEGKGSGRARGPIHVEGAERLVFCIERIMARGRAWGPSWGLVTHRGARQKVMI